MTDDLRVPPPDLVDDRKIRDALVEYLRMQEERNAAAQAAYDLQASLGTAAEADRQALADALRRGEADPGDVATTRAASGP